MISSGQHIAFITIGAYRHRSNLCILYRLVFAKLFDKIFFLRQWSFSEFITITNDWVAIYTYLGPGRFWPDLSQWEMILYKPLHFDLAQHDKYDKVFQIYSWNESLVLPKRWCVIDYRPSFKPTMNRCSLGPNTISDKEHVDSFI